MLLKFELPHLRRCDGVALLLLLQSNYGFLWITIQLADSVQTTQTNKTRTQGEVRLSDVSSLFILMQGFSSFLSL